MEIHKLLKLARKKAGLSQEDVAIKIGTKQKVISRYETGEVEPTIGRFKELCDLYKASADEILGLAPGAHNGQDKIEANQAEIKQPTKREL